MDLEIAVQDAAGAAVAIAAGADRVELCQALSSGGLTPSVGTIDAVLAAAGSGERVAVLVRARPGGFVYDDAEIGLVAADVREAVRRGVGGVVVGALRPDGTVDAEAMRRWIDVAGAAEVTFHRAIDTVADPVAAVDELAALGVHRVLTSGGAHRSIDGAEVLSAMARCAAGRMQIMVGGGVGVADIPGLVGTGVDAVHMSARRPASDPGISGPGGGIDGYDVTDAGIVAAARAALDALR